MDVLEEAVELARENAVANGIPLLGEDRKTMGEGNMFEVLKRDIFTEGFLEEMLGGKEGEGEGRRSNPDVLTSNPPYIPLKEMQSLDRSVSEYESHLALVGDVPHLIPPSVRLPPLSSTFCALLSLVSSLTSSLPLSLPSLFSASDR